MEEEAAEIFFGFQHHLKKLSLEKKADFRKKKFTF